MRPAMLVDVFWPLLAVLEDNPDAPVREAVTWEKQLAEGGTDALLRLAYADRLAAWGCATREAAVRSEAARIAGGETLPPTRHGIGGVLYFPPGQTEYESGGVTVARDNIDLARELLETCEGGATLVLPAGTGWRYEWAGGPSGAVETPT